MSMLEQRYLRLLALYPAWHRQRYQAEMLTTLMDGAAQRQRAPRLRESLDLLWNAVRLRLNRDTMPTGSDPRWAVAAAVFGPLAAITLGALIVMSRVAQLGWYQRIGDQRIWLHLGWRLGLVLGVGFAVIGALALTGWRKVAAALACVAVLAYGGWHLASYTTDPTVLVHRWPLIVFMATVAACLAFSATARPRLRTLLGARLLVLFLAGAALIAASLWIDAMLAHVVDYDWGLSITYWGGSYSVIQGVEPVGVVPLVIYFALLAVVVRMLVKVGGPMRRRALSFAAVPILMYFFVTNLYHGFVASSMRFYPTPVLLTVGQWLGMLLMPLLIFAVCFFLVRRKENLDELIALGRVHQAKVKMSSGEIRPDAIDG